eukprot:Gb_25540 [translate_table: standard]
MNGAYLLVDGHCKYALESCTIEGIQRPLSTSLGLVLFMMFVVSDDKYDMPSTKAFKGGIRISLGSLAGYGLVGDDEGSGPGGTVSVHIESSYVVNLRDMDMKHVKDFTFIHGKYIVNIHLFPVYFA